MGRSSNSKGAWDLGAIERPWQDAPSIYVHIAKHLSSDGKGLTEDGARLPDEKDDGGLKWVAGGLDGAFGHHGGGGAKKDRARMLHRALTVVLEDATAPKLTKLYQQLLDDSAIDYVDPLAQLIVQKQDLDAERLEELAVWLATNSPDRQPVKIAVALLGLVPGADRTELLMTLGRHEEFTLYAAVALANRGGADAEHRLFELARQVDGWGRIQIVERLADTTDPAIKAWMLREGYRNEVMHEYLAYTCATAGGLRAELEKESVDPELLRGAGEIIRALIAGGPAQDMDDYADGAAVVERYLCHVGGAARDIGHLVTAHHIERFLDQEKANWKARAGRGWTTALRDSLRRQIRAFEALSDWSRLIDARLASGDRVAFYEADEAAKVLGIDTWERHFARLESDDAGSWFYVMQTDDPARIDRVVAVAEQKFPLADVNLDFVLQELRRFPGKGWTLIRAGLRSPVIRTRYMALHALSPWGKSNWPGEAEAALRAALAEEPEAGVRKEVKVLLAGKQIADDDDDAG
jgi:hypothetical protein